MPQESKQPEVKLLFKTNECHFLPENFSTLIRERHIDGGSGGVDVLRDPITDKLYTFKAHATVSHLQEEIISDALYKAAGCPVPEFAVVNQLPPCLKDLGLPANGVYRLAEFITPHKQPNETLIKEQLSKHFLVDALFSNWDICVDLKNVILDALGVVHRIDNGGAWRYHATKGLKEHNSDWSAYHVDEFDNLRNPKINKDAASVYQSLSKEELVRQHKELLSHVPAMFETLGQLSQVFPHHKVEQLKYMLQSRLYDLDLRLHDSPHPYATALKSVRADKKQNSASMLPTALVKDKDTGEEVACALLGQRIGHQWYGDFGGASEKTDRNLFVTAWREAGEETGDALKVTPEGLERYPSHDLITKTPEEVLTSEAKEDGLEKKKEPIHTHRMFITEEEYIAPEKLMEKVKNSSNKKEQENFAWIPIHDLLAAIKDNQIIEEEGQKTIVVNYTCPVTKEKKQISLFPPMLKMLSQLPVQDTLRRKQEGQDLGAKRTRSHANVDYSQYQSRPTVMHTTGNEYVSRQTVNYKGEEVQELVQEILYLDLEERDKKLRQQVIASSFVNRDIKKEPVSVPVVNVESKEEQVREPIELKSTHKNRAEKKWQVAAPKEVKQSTPTQSIAHLQSELGNFTEQKAETLVKALIAKEHPDWNDPEFTKKLIQVIEVESQFANHAVLYHATDAQIGFITTVFSELRSCLAFEDIQGLRAFEEDFEGLSNVEDFIADQCNKQGITDRQDLDNYKKGYQQKGLSTNIGLLFNHASSGSSTVNFFRTNSANTKATELIKGITFILSHLKINSVKAEEFLALYEKHERHLSAHLYQIFLKEEELDNFCYYSSYHGRYFKKPWLEDLTLEDYQTLLPDYLWALLSEESQQELSVEALQKLPAADLQTRLPNNWKHVLLWNLLSEKTKSRFPTQDIGKLSESDLQTLLIEGSHKLSPFIKALRNNPEIFAKKVVQNLDHKDSIQARLFMHPNLMHNTTTKHYTWEESQRPLHREEQFQAELSILIQRMVRELLQKKQDLERSYRSNTQAGLTPLQRKYTAVMRDQAMLEIGYHTSIDYDLLFKQIEEGDPEAFENTLKSLGDDFDPGQGEVDDFSGHTKPSLVDKIIQKNDEKFIKILLKRQNLSSKCADSLIPYFIRKEDIALIKTLAGKVGSPEPFAELIQYLDDKNEQNFLKELFKSKKLSSECYQHVIDYLIKKDDLDLIKELSLKISWSRMAFAAVIKYADAKIFLKVYLKPSRLHQLVISI